MVDIAVVSATPPPKAQELLGLDAKQFSKVAMIAQGDFLSILQAGSSDRADIFRRIFGTSLYAEITERLKHRLARAKGELDGEIAAYRALAGQLSLPEHEAEQAAYGDAYGQADKLLSLAAAVIQRDGEEGGVLETEESRLRKESNEYAVRLQTAEGQNLGVESLRRKAAEQRALLAQAPSMEEAQRKLEAAERALSIAPLKATAQREKERLGALEKQHAARRGDAVRAEQSLAQAVQALENARLEQPRRDELAQKLQKLDAALPLFAECFAARALRELRVQEAERAIAAKADAEQAYARLSGAYLADQAGILAETLRPGAPCPVCGALEHPAPAAHRSNAPDKKDVERAEKARKDAETRAGKATELAAAARQAAARLEERLEAALNGKQPTEELERECQALRQRLQLALDGLDKALADAQAAWQSASAARQTAVSRLEDAENALTAQTGTAAEAVSAWQNALGDHGFPDEGAFEGAVLPEAALRTLKADIQGFDQKRNKGEADLQSLTQLWAGKEPVDTAALRAEKLATDGRLAALAERRRSLEARLAQNRRALPQLQACTERMGRFAEEAHLTADLYRTASGSIPGAQKLPFENYILQYYFRRMLVEANRRLNSMSAGRYRLCQKREETGQAKGGLLLDVLDNYTGKLRDVSTLSGGESFLASLALALGFADTVQARKGGVQLDALFIDEGFGSLDEESLGRAMDVLNSLTDGRRLIGVISHVAALKDSIPKKLLVRREPLGGSHVTVE